MSTDATAYEGASCGPPLVHRPWFPRGAAIGLRPCDAPCPEAARPFVLAATVLGSAMAFIDGTVVGIALPAIQASLDASFIALQWVVNGYTLLLGALILVGGALGDRIGRRRVYIAGIGVFAIASALCGLAPDAPSLIAARAAQGIGAALLVPQSLAIIAASFPKEVRGRAIGLWAGFAALTTALGPLLGGAFIDLLSWRWVFWINLPLAALTVWLCLRFVPESRAATVTGRLDVAGAGLAAAGLGALTFGLTAWPERGLGDGAVIGAVIAGAAALAAMLLVERRAAAPMMPLGLFRSADFSAANLITLLLYFALSGVLFLLPFDLIQRNGYGALEAGLALLPFGLVMAAFSGLAGRLADRVGARAPLVAGPLIVAAGCAGFALADAGVGYWAGVFAPVVLLAVGMTVSVAPLTTAVMNAVPETQSGVASGVNNAAARIAGLIGVAVVGMLATALFAARLETGLGAINLPGEAAATVLARAGDLAGLAAPAGLAPQQAAALDVLVGRAFLDGYRAGMLAAAACALLAAVTALTFLTGPKARQARAT